MRLVDLIMDCEIIWVAYAHTHMFNMHIHTDEHTQLLTHSLAECAYADVQITWAPTHSDKCVMYQAITPTMAGGADGWVKCNANDASVQQCTGAYYSLM